MGSSWTAQQHRRSCALATRPFLRKLTNLAFVTLGATAFHLVPDFRWLKDGI